MTENRKPIQKLSTEELCYLLDQAIYDYRAERTLEQIIENQRRVEGLSVEELTFRLDAAIDQYNADPSAENCDRMYMYLDRLQSFMEEETDTTVGQLYLDGREIAKRRKKQQQ